MAQKSPVFIALVTLAMVAVDCKSLEDAARDIGHMAKRVGGIEVADGSHEPMLNAVVGQGEPGHRRAAAARDDANDAAGMKDDLGEGPDGTEASEPMPMEVDWSELGPADGDEQLGDEGDGAGNREQDEPGDGDAPASDQQDEPRLEGPPQLASIARETWVFSQPLWKSRRLGYLRAGAIVTRDSEPVSHQSCKRGWYRIRPRGYVCAGSTASLDVDHPVVQLSARRPQMGELPFLYVMSRYPTPPMYARLPSVAQQKRVEPARHYHQRKHDKVMRDPDYVPPPPPDTLPPQLTGGAVLPGLGGVDRGPQRVLLRHARVRSGFALLGSYEHEGRRFGLTTEMALLPLDRTRVVQPSAFRGVRLSDEFDLPIAIVRSRFARRYRVHEETRALAIEGKVPWRSVVGLTGKSRHHRGHYYLEAVDGSWLRGDRVVRIDRFRQAPKWARQGKRWIDVSLLRQTLVAYEGRRPVYATLVSTGAGGIGDPKKTHATVQGTFLIHTKHITVTMDGDDAGDEFDLRDVPYVQYFTDGYAFHGAYWHDDFGTPRSHGCVNLSPLDAAWLFQWTDPQVPEGWHAALSLKKGTTVYIHP